MDEVSSATTRAVQEESAHRDNFHLLLAENPNYFGNLPGSSIAPVVPLLNDTAYEELTCVGYNPQRKVLEATVDVKLPYGFGGGLCTAGSWEYVRFWLDYGSGWQNAGLAGINVHDLPGGTDCAGQQQLPVSYIAALSIDPETSFCDFPVLPKVRAILSWDVVPPATPSAAVPQPADWQPVFGNVLESHIQTAPRLLILADVLSRLEVSATELPPDMQAALEVPIPVPGPGPLGVAALAALYAQDAGPRETAVPGHRFGIADLTAAARQGTDPVGTVSTIESWTALGLDWASAVTALAELDADVSFEQLDCVGLDVAQNRLVGTVTIKLPTGYSGDLCTAGSTEYVSFWGDFGNPDCALTYLGTATVPVHDIASIPPGGLTYAVVLPVDLSAFAAPCDQPVIGRVRAVLSWNVPPSTTDPDAMPYWGNRLDVHVQAPLASPGAGTGPNIFAIGGIGVASIDSSYDPNTQTTGGSGLTLPGAHFAFTGAPTDTRACPFGGEVVINGEPVPGGSYRMQVRNLSQGTGWTTLVNPVTVIDSNGVLGNNTPVGEYYPYLSHLSNEFGALADWFTTSDDQWEIKLDARDAASNPLGEVRYRIQLDNTPPTADIHIDSGGDCKKFAVGVTITGHFVAIDPNNHFGSYALSILPDNLPGGTGILTPTAGTAQTAPPPGDPWSLDTTGMSACAYVATVQARDRTIVSSSTVGWYSPLVAVGFSLD
jgi:hypothetical protein